jgi:DNA-binding response OmpR family regulator
MSSALSEPSSFLLHGRVNIFDGDREVGEQLRTVLSNAGAEVFLTDSEDAISPSLLARLPDLLLLDIDMTGGNTTEIIRQIKASDETRYLPIIILTGDGVDPEQCLEAGADDFLKQPVQPAELLLRAKILMRLGRLHQDLADNNSELQAAYETARESEAKYRALIQDAQDAIILVDPSSETILEANHHACDLSGYTNDEMLGQPIFLLCSDGKSGKWPEIIARVTAEVQGRLANHHLGEALIQILIRDIRPRLQLETERAKSERLAAVVETAVTVNHEINNPLLVITSSVDSLQRALYNSESGVREKLERISEACQRIERFTQQLASVIEPVSKEYLPGMNMLDIQQSVSSSSSGTPPS